LTKEDYYYNVKDGRKRFYGNTIAVHSDHELDVEHPKNFFRREVRRVEDEAFDQDSAYWASKRPITLKKAELDFIRVQDSTQRYHRSDEYLREQDSTYNRITIWDVLLNGVGFRDRPRGMRYYINAVAEQVKPFGVGGYRHALGGSISKTFKKYNALAVQGEIDYGFANRDIKGYVKTSYTYAPKRFAKAYVKFGDRYAMVNNFETIAAVFSRSNYIRKIYYGVGHKFELVNGLLVDTEVEFADRRAIDDIRLATWSNNIFGSSNNPREFDPYREALLHIRLKWTPGQKYIMEPNRKILVASPWPVFTFHYKKAIPGIWNSEINFDYVELQVRDEFRPG
ncbi:MAG: DUF5686 family protein, partial [Bacteroidota bacterium]